MPRSHNAAPLSILLRTRTAPSHARIEARLGLPGAIRDRAGYADWLAGLLGLHEPLEAAILAAPGWARLAHDPAPHARVPALEADLRALGRDPAAVPRADARVLPALGDGFGRRLGALYVLAGSALGGRVIARALRPRLGPAVAGAMEFLEGTDPARAAAQWRGLREALDRFGAGLGDAEEEVVAGAEATFAAFEAWLCGGAPPSRAHPPGA